MRAVLIAALFAAALAIECKVKTPAGYEFDLAPISSPTSYSKKSVLNDNFFVNFCAPVVTCGANKCGCTPTGQGVCQQGANGKWYGCGTFASVNYTDTPKLGGGLLVTYGKGQPCGSNPRTSKITIACGTSEALVFNTVVEDVGCVYTMSMEAKAACPTNGKGGLGGWIFVIIVTVGFAVYCIAGAIFGYVKGARGKEMIPNLSFWTDLPALIKDGAFFAKDKVFGLCGR